MEQGKGNPDNKPSDSQRRTERIREAALEYNGERFTGHTHTNAIVELMKAYPDIFKDASGDEVAYGFVTTNNRFVSSDEAVEIARENDQLLPNAEGETSLRSEHLKGGE
ncbi:MAG: hypothetical protein G01um10148_899 [Parcubacteria group bacterium Gr01-1014_8]|nr:MAG: hypothetical protein G01um10148_899 [Parcubacteria group bacterium Gr01-1014_8]